MDDFAEPSDVASDWGELTVADEERVAEWISQASDKLRLKGLQAGIDVDELVATNDLAKRGAKNAVVSAIRRRLNNPRGQQQFSQTDGPFAQSGTFAPALASGSLYIADEDLAGWLIKPKRRRLQSFTIRRGF